MFKRNDNDRSFDTQAPTPGPQSQTMEQTIEMRPSSRQPMAAIGPSIIVRGDITGEEDLMIQGRIEGTMQLPQNDLTVGPDGKVKADLKALKIEVQGEVIGDLHGVEKVVVKRSGKVEGNINAPRVVLEDGCRFKGAVDMNISDDADRNTSSSEKKSMRTQDKKKATVTTVMDDPVQPVANVAHASGSS